MSTATYTRELRFASVPQDLPADAALPATLATITPVDRYGVREVLDCSPAGVDFSRAPLSLIVAHDQGRLAVGVVEDLVAHGERVTGMVRFGTSPEAQQIREDVLAGVHRYLSVGYRLTDEGRGLPDGAVMFRWQPLEVSIVPVPADPAAGFFRSLSPSQGLPTMTTATLTREAEINDLCAHHGVQDLAQGLIRANNTIEQARAAVLEELARRDRASGGHLNVRSQAVSNERETLINTLIARMGGRPTGDVLGQSDCTNIAVRALQLGGHAIDSRDGRDRILTRALATSDFANLLGTAVGRVLKESYAAAPAALKAVAKLVLLPDFRDRSVVRLSDSPDLLPINEHGEYKHGAMSDAANAWRLTTFGRIVSLTRKALVNDDLGGFADLLTKFGQAAARREADELTAVLTTPPNVDGAALFSAGRSSLITGAGSALQLSSLGEAVKALRKQTDMAGGGLIVQEPGALVVPAALEMTARQLVAQFAPVTAGTVQPWPLSVVVEPRLDAASATAWYLAAGNQNSLEYGYLDSEQGLQVFQEDGFDIDGLSVKARLDFGCGWSAPVGWVKANGA